MGNRYSSTIFAAVANQTAVLCTKIGFKRPCDKHFAIQKMHRSNQFYVPIRKQTTKMFLCTSIPAHCFFVCGGAVRRGDLGEEMKKSDLVTLLIKRVSLNKDTDNAPNAVVFSYYRSSTKRR